LAGRDQVALDMTAFPFPTYLMATTEYQNGTWVPMENWWYDILDIGLNSSELRAWRIMFNDDEGGWSTLTFNSGIIWAKRPMAVGDSWASSAGGTYSEGPDTFPISITVNSEVLAYEPVDVPFGNGTYNAFKIRHVIQIPRLAQVAQTFWAVPYLGIIKHESVEGDGYDMDYLSAMDIATVFTDALNDHWAYPFIMQIYDEGVTLGYGDGRYGPDDPVTREQMAVFITRALEEVPTDGYCGTTSPFTDVPYSWWSCKYVKMLSELHITSGYGDGRYGPGDPITRAQMAVFLSRTFLGI
jgi:hypothetical protein